MDTMTIVLILLFIVFVIPGMYLLIKSAVKNFLEAEKELKEIRKKNRNSS